MLMAHSLNVIAYSCFLLFVYILNTRRTFCDLKTWQIITSIYQFEFRKFNFNVIPFTAPPPTTNQNSMSKCVSILLFNVQYIVVSSRFKNIFKVLRDARVGVNVNFFGGD